MNKDDSTLLNPQETKAEIRGDGINTILQNSRIKKIHIHSQSLHPYKDRYIQMKENEKEVCKKNDLEKIAILNILKIIGSFLGILVSIFGNLNSIVNYIGIHFNISNFYLLILFLGLFIYFFYNQETRTYLAGLTLRLNEISELTYSFTQKDWYFVTRDKSKNYIIFRMIGNCSYPHCHGKITLCTPPVKEQANHTMIGICSIGGRQHTYRIDNNFKGYVKEFDWEIPIPPKN